MPFTFKSQVTLAPYLCATNQDTGYINSPETKIVYFNFPLQAQDLFIYASPGLFAAKLYYNIYIYFVSSFLIFIFYFSLYFLSSFPLVFLCPQQGLPACFPGLVHLSQPDVRPQIYCSASLPSGSTMLSGFGECEAAFMAATSA